MTNQIRSNDQFRHISILQLRQILKALGRTRDLDSIGKHGKVQLQPEAVYAIIQESIDQGLISLVPPPEYPDSPPQLTVTDSGRAIATATARKRASKKVGHAALNDVLERVEKLNNSPHAPIKVERLWVFGSLIDTAKSDIGDVDISVEFSRTELFDKVGLKLDHYKKYFPELHIDNVSPFWLAPYYFSHRAVFGVRRHPLISPVEINELVDLHVPCVLAYDRSQGRLPVDRIIPHHPRSEYRADRMGERLKVPELTGPDRNFRPSSAEILEEHFLHSWYNRYVDVCSASLPEDICSKMSHRVELDANDRFALVFNDDHGNRRPFVVLVERGLEEQGDDFWIYRCRVSVIPVGNEPSGGSTRYEQAIISEAVKLTVGADMHRLVWLRRETNPYAEIFMDVNVSLDDLEFEGLRKTIQSEAGDLTADPDGHLSQSMYYGVMVRDDEGVGTGRLHWRDLDEDDIEELPEDFPISKEEILSHPDYPGSVVPATARLP